MNKKILVVDDEADALEILAKKLKENNYHVKTASSGEEAINLAKMNKPDLILMDIAMPDMDGYNVAIELKKDATLKDVPIIFITGKDLEYHGIEKRVSELGAYDYLEKPCTFVDILKKVQEAIGF